ncbi:hypothetical protein [uncultured Rhodospira sp.]|uniref:hypothetical protein n=1 Tax=uncultured Rhodospira sp. TaxID=1936189 RepID=UPI00262EF236|nr:hypothetical protein [uncultured Rhodospira sp.]
MRLAVANAAADAPVGRAVVRRACGADAPYGFLSHETIGEIEMPNRDGLVPDSGRDALPETRLSG